MSLSKLDEICPFVHSRVSQLLVREKESGETRGDGVRAARALEDLADAREVLFALCAGDPRHLLDLATPEFSAT